MPGGGGGTSSSHNDMVVVPIVLVVALEVVVVVVVVAVLACMASACRGTHGVSQTRCGGQRTTCRSLLFSTTMCDVRSLAGQQVVYPLGFLAVP